MINKETETFFEYFFSNSSPDCTINELGKVTGYLLWSLDEEKFGSVTEIVNEWYESDDVFKVAVALHIPMFFPRESRVELVEFLDRMERRWPVLSPRCKAILEIWDKEGMDLQFKEMKRTEVASS